MAIVKTNYLKHEDNYYEIIPPVPTESDRGGIVASTKTSTDTVEAKLGDDGKLYVPDVNAAISAHNTNTSAHTDIQERLNELESNPYTLPQATGSTLGGVTIGDNVQVSNGKISVKNSNTSQPGVVQLTDSASSTSTTTAATPNSVKKAYDLANTAKTNAANAQTAADEAKASAVTAQTTAESGVSKANAAQSAVDALSDEVTVHTGNADIHFTTVERTKLSGIEAGAQKNTITGVKGSSESSYRTGNVNITKANIGLGNVNNTADSAKPVSTAQQTAIDSALAEAKSYTDTKISGHNHDTKYDTKGAADVALDEAKDYTDTKVANLASTTVVDNKISSHNVSTSSHNDIRGLITALTTKVNNFLDVDDTTTDQLSEVLTLINNNKGTLDSLTSGKVNVSDIVDNITTSSSTKVLSAKQGVALKGLIDTLQTALDALESEFDGHGHAIADVSGLQTALDGKAAKSHGTHVSYSTTAPVMDGKASVGSASTVARSDHKHPTDTSRASQVDLDALEAIVDGKANNAHSHAIPDITNLQTILDAKQSIITGGASTITGSNLTANRALISNGSGKVSVSAVTSTELGYLDGVTSSVQTQLDSKSSASHTHKYAGSSSAGGSANSAVKLATARTIGLSGDMTGSVSFDGSANATITAKRRRCTVGQSSNTITNPYYKFASIKLTAANTDAEIVFKVSTGYSRNSASGILRAHFRVGSDIKRETAEIYWEYANSGIDNSKFVMAYSNDASPTIELWVKIDVSYLHYQFDVLQEHNRTGHTNSWTLYNTSSAGSASAITSGYTQVTSSFLTIKNSISGSAVSATKATQDASGNTITSTYATKSELNTAKSNLQASIDAKQATITGGASTITSSNLTANRALVSNGSGKVAVSAVTSTELGYLDGVTSNIQAQLNALPTDDELTATYMTKENPTGTGSFSMNRLADSTVGDYSFAEGYNSSARGLYSHAEGFMTTASLDGSHAEGIQTTAYAMASHAEGSDTTASSPFAHAEGFYTAASGRSSHAEGEYTIACSHSQHVQGQFNIEDTEGTYAHIIGNGESEDTRSNAHTVDWEGNAWFAGDVISTDANGNSVSLNELNSTTQNLESTKISIDDSGIHFVKDLILPISNYAGGLPVTKIYMNWNSAHGWCLMVKFFYNNEIYTGCIKLTESSKDS